MGYLTAFQAALLGLTIVSLVLLVWKGRTPERIAAASLASLFLVTPFLDEGDRLGVAALSALSFGVLTWLSLKHDRHWLIVAAGFQLIALATHLVPLLEPGSRMWAAVSFRLLVWLLLMLVALFGVGEARWAPYATSARRR